jgi:hypothetical protein
MPSRHKAQEGEIIKSQGHGKRLVEVFSALENPCSRDCLDPIKINVNEFIGCQKNLHPRPYPPEKSMEISASKIAETQMDHPWWRLGNKDLVGEISVLCHNDRVVGFRVAP